MSGASRSTVAVGRARRADPARVEALFDAVVDLEPEEAARRLDAECEEDAVLRAAVERLVASDREAAASFLSPPVAALAEALSAPLDSIAAPLDATMPALSASPERLARIGRFFVLRVLGEGGMGIVYVGYDETLDRRVALKLLRRGAGGGDWLKREGQALGRLADPHVVAVHEIGEHEGRVYLAMELVDGQTLRAWLATPRAFAEVCGIFVQAGRGLAAAHAAGLVHRDFKAENVLVGADGRARVADFGIAALVAPDEPGAGPSRVAGGQAGTSEAESDRPLTQAGALVGTPAYMAPELLRRERATPASDQWAFCVAFYKAVYGAAPFRDDDLPTLLQSIADDPPAPPPRRADVPVWLGPILLRGLSKDPAARFPSMDALLDALARRLPRDPDLDPAAVRRERRILAVAVAVASLSVAVFVFVGGVARVLASTWAPVRIAAGMVCVVLVAAALLRRRLAKSLYGRRSASLVVVGLLAMLVHRLAAVRLGTPLHEVLIVDSILLASAFAVGAVLLERGLGWSAALALSAAVVGLWEPAWVLRAFAVANFAAATALIVVWGRRS